VAPGLLLLAFLQAAASLPRPVLVAQGKPLLTPAPFLDLAFLDDQRLLALSEATLFLYRLDGGGPLLESRLELPGDFLPVRAAAGVLRVAETEAACWALTNRRVGASLVAVEGRRLVLRLEADAIPWPGSATGLRYRAGTNELSLEGVDYFALRDDGLGVSDTGALLIAGQPDAQGRRSGTAAAGLGTLIVTSSHAPVGAPDALLLLRLRDGATELLSETPAPGRVRALAARERRRGGRLLAAAVEDPDDGPVLIVYAVSDTP
jgi:hypothetical protein